MKHRRPFLVFVTTDRTVNAAPLAESLSSAGYDVIMVRHADGEPFPRQQDLAAVVVFGPLAPDIPEALKGEPIPLIAIGGPPPDPSQVVCWLPKIPEPQVLRSLIAAHPDPVPATDFKQTPRRKGDAIIGNSKAITSLLRTLDRVAPSAAPVLITGESGTGKELVARALHFGGPRVSAPFIAINCAAIPETLFEAELFGYERGAFTGAVSARPGAFEAANGGTIFLDEIGEMPLAIQAKLLRVLDTGEVTRLGSSRSVASSARVVAATNRDLEQEVAAGRFREDLYYRIKVYPVHIPPLRERLEDIPPLTRHHLLVIAERERQLVPRLTAGAIEKLLSYSWPGNVRELVGTLERAFLLVDAGVIGPDQIVLPETADLAPPIPPYRTAKIAFEMAYYSKLLRAAFGNISLAARLAQKTRKEVYDAVKRLKLDAESYRTDQASADG